MIPYNLISSIIFARNAKKRFPQFFAKVVSKISAQLATLRFTIKARGRSTPGSQ